MHPIGVAVCVGPYIKEWRAYTGGILHLPSMSPLDGQKLCKDVRDSVLHWSCSHCPQTLWVWIGLEGCLLAFKMQR